MSSIYAVTLSWTAMVRADDDQSAGEMARESYRDVLRDAGEPDDVHVEQEIKAIGQLSLYGWDGECLPYGDTDGNTRLGEYLGAHSESKA